MIAAILLAGALGAVLRFLVAHLARPGFPWAVLIVNVSGSLIAGLASNLDGDLRLIVLTGFCGGLTTFSTFSVETIQLVLAGKSRQAALSVGGNLVLGIAAAAVGCCLGYALLG